MKLTWAKIATLAAGLATLTTPAIAADPILGRQATTSTISTLSSSSTSNSAFTSSPPPSTSSASSTSGTTASSSSGSASTITTTSSSASASPTTTPSNSTTSNNAATFTYQLPEGNIYFSLTANNSDLWFRMTCPHEYGWCAVGTGSYMDSSLMFVMYEDNTDTGVVLSGRRGVNHVEPTYDPTIKLFKVAPQANDTWHDGQHDGAMTVTGHCQNCFTIPSLNVHIDSTAQAFIWAVGPVSHWPNTGSEEGPLRKHAYYGHFNVDMTASRGSGPPMFSRMMKNVEVQGTSVDHDYADGLHAFVMVATFLIIFPLGVLALRLRQNVRLHSMLQTGGMILIVIGAATGFYLTTLYNRSKHFNTAHQIIGLLVFLLILVQWTIGFLNHRSHLKSQIPWKSGKPIKIHTYLGPILISLGLINIALGFRLAVAGYLNLFYVPLVIFLCVATFLVGAVRRFMAKRRAARMGGHGRATFVGDAPPPPSNAPPPSGGYYGQSTAGPYSSNRPGYEPSRSDIQLQNLGEPPIYHMPPVQPKHMI